MSSDALEGPVLIKVGHDPTIFEQTLNDWRTSGNTAALSPEERVYHPEHFHAEGEELGAWEGKPATVEQATVLRTEQEQAEFADGKDSLRELAKQWDLEKASRTPVISVAVTPPGGFPVQHKTPRPQAIHVTDRAHQIITTGPQRPIEAVPEAQTQVIAVGEADVSADTDGPGEEEAAAAEG